MKKSRKKPPFHDIFHFNEVWRRIISKTPIKNYKELSEIVGVTPQNITKRKNENYFPPDWAFYIAFKFNLSTKWIMTGKGSINSDTNQPNFKNDILYEIDEWLTEKIKEQPFRKDWFECSFLDAFPLFAEWQKCLEQEERKDISIQNKAA